MRRELSYEEKALVNIMNHIESMAVLQAERIMSDIYGVSKGQAEYIVKHLCDIDILKKTADKNYVYVNGKQNNLRHILNPNVMAALCVAINMIDRTEDISFVQRTDQGNPTDISFTSNGKFYKTLTVDTESMYKINSYQEQVLKEAKQIDKKYPEIHHTTIIIFHSNNTEDEMFDALESIDILIPHMIVRFKGNDYYNCPDYDVFSAD